mmetsp:Transcript_82091/g.171842  ORF Transcript_82091/g.171842 Transcript_82091/m.171842 type:complete len:503 (+) Transcript_82091:58-1566(+)
MGPSKMLLVIKLSALLAGMAAETPTLAPARAASPPDEIASRSQIEEEQKQEDSLQQQQQQEQEHPHQRDGEAQQQQQHQHQQHPELEPRAPVAAPKKPGDKKDGDEHALAPVPPEGDLVVGEPVMEDTPKEHYKEHQQDSPNNIKLHPGNNSHVASAVFGHPTPGKVYPTHEGFTLWLVEEFEEPLDLDNDHIWTWSDGGLGEGQVRFTKENLVFEDGKMKIVAKKANQGDWPPQQWCSHAEVNGMPNKPLTSGEIRTKHNQFRYGRYEVRMKPPSVRPGDGQTNGNYISTMFAYRDAKYRHWREIDIEVTGDSSRSVTMNVLFAENQEGWLPQIQSTKLFGAPEGTNLREEFHDLAFVWLPDKITWYFDGEEIAIHDSTVSSLPIPELSTKIMMNLWIFNEGYGFGGHEGWNNQYPMQSEYEWFRFYKWDGDNSYPCSDGGSSCLTEDDRYLAGNNPCDGIAQEGLRNGWPACDNSFCPYSASAEVKGARNSEPQEASFFP